jgi:hypothetical protein
MSSITSLRGRAFFMEFLIEFCNVYHNASDDITYQIIYYIFRCLLKYGTLMTLILYDVLRFFVTLIMRLKYNAF